MCTCRVKQNGDKVANCVIVKKKHYKFMGSIWRKVEPKCIAFVCRVFGGSNRLIVIIFCTGLLAEPSIVVVSDVYLNDIMLAEC